MITIRNTFTIQYIQQILNKQTQPFNTKSQAKYMNVSIHNIESTRKLKKGNNFLIK